MDFDETFSSEKHWLWKVAGAGLIGLYVACRTVAEGWDEMSVADRTVTIVAIPASLCLAGALLAKADSVRRAVRRKRLRACLKVIFRVWNLVILSVDRRRAFRRAPTGGLDWEPHRRPADSLGSSRIDPGHRQSSTGDA